jgi:hypothetical protein
VIEEKEMDDITLHKIQDWQSKTGKRRSLATTKNINNRLNRGSLPPRQVLNPTGSHQQINTLLSGLFFSASLLLTSNGGGKGSGNSTTRDLPI